MKFDTDVTEENIKKANSIHEEYVVAFLDIMGFKEKVYREGIDSLNSKLQIIQSKYQDNNNFSYKLFSDSIVFLFAFKEDELISQMDNIINIFKEYLIQGLPVKGAIAKGRMIVDENKNIFIGQPLIDAYLLEEDIEIYGVAFHHTMETYARKFIDSQKTFDKIIPLKSAKSKHYILNVYDKKIEDKISDYRNYVSGKPRRYIDNTLAIISEGQGHD